VVVALQNLKQIIQKLDPQQTNRGTLLILVTHPTVKQKEINQLFIKKFSIDPNKAEHKMYFEQFNVDKEYFDYCSFIKFLFDQSVGKEEENSQYIPMYGFLFFFAQKLIAAQEVAEKRKAGKVCKVGIKPIVSSYSALVTAL